MFRLRLFGSVSLTGPSGPLTGRVTQPRALALLSLLAAAEDGLLSRDKLVAYLWPEADDERARQLLSVNLHVVRKALRKDAVNSVGSSLRLNLGLVATDVREFETALADGELQRAVELFAGPFMDGFHLRGSAEFERWLDGERSRLDSRYAEALEALAERAETDGDFGRAAELWRRLAAHDPFSSRIAARLMAAAATAGDRPAALQHARAHTRLLRDELGVEPDLEVTALADRLETHEAGRQRLIALPFRMLRPDEETEFLAFSLPDAITSSLAGIRSLTVRSPLAAVRYAEEPPDLEEIAKRAQVDLVLTGTLLRIGERIAVTTHLTDVRDGTLLWSETATVDLGDLFQLREQLARRIVDSLALPLTPSERRNLSRDKPATARAYEFYLRGNTLLYDVANWGTARDLYLAGLEEDPDFAPAWAKLGRCYRMLAKFGSDAQENRRQLDLAVQAFQRALELNPDLALAHNLYAHLEIDLGRAEDAMLRLLDRARRTPGDAQFFAGLVHALRYLGLLEPSLAAHHGARRLDPEIPTSVSHTYWMLGRYERVLDCTFGDIGYVAGVALASMGRTEEAIRILRRNEHTPTKPRARAYVLSLRALLEGDRATALDALETAATGMVDGEALYYAARSYGRLGEGERAVAAFEESVRLGFVCVPLFERDPWLDGLRRSQRFRALLECGRERHHRAADAFATAGGPELLAEPGVTSYTAPT
jgi:DNA-binding SARP family transcriptional activator